MLEVAHQGEPIQHDTDSERKFSDVDFFERFNEETDSSDDKSDATCQRNERPPWVELDFFWETKIFPLYRCVLSKEDREFWVFFLK